MDLIWIFIAVIVAANILLNVMGTNIVRSSEIHDNNKKRNLLIVLWGVPLLGVFLAMIKINKDIKANQAKMEEEIAPAIRQMADRLKVLDADIALSKSKKNPKIH